MFCHRDEFACNISPAPLEYIHPKAIESTPTSPNEIGMEPVRFSVDDIDRRCA